jgi:hypothetical protein
MGYLVPDTLTRLAALGTPSRDAGEGLQDVASQTLSCTVGEGGTQPVGPATSPFDFDRSVMA